MNTLKSSRSQRYERLKALLGTTIQDETEEITTELVNNEEGFNNLQNEWNSLGEISGAHIFQTFEWQQLWWKYFSGDRRLHIITFRKKK